MRRHSVRTKTALLVLALAAAGAPALAGTSHAWDARAFDRNLSHDPQHEDGEPSIAVNPHNPDNMIVIYLRNNDMFVPNAANGEPPPDDAARDATQQIQGCDYAVTFDGGRTWTRKALPANDFSTDPTENNCSDSIVVFDRKGAAYVMASAYGSFAFAAEGQYRMLRSTNGGRTWGKPAVVAPGEIGQGTHPQNYKGLRTYDDRPWLTIDPQTRTLYIDGTQVRADGSGTNTVYLTASTDLGKTWSDPIVVPAANLASAPLGAAYGILALTVKPPSGEAGCACLDFLTSRNNGKSLHRLHTKIPAAGSPQTVADPTHKGRFSVMVNTGSQLLVYTTNDTGRTWQGPSKLSVQDTTVVKPWIAYSPSGVLGVGWRATRSDGSYAFYVTVSDDKGKTFLGLRRLSTKWSKPAPDYYVAGDDTSTVALSRNHLFAAWGDWRNKGLEDIYWGGVPLPRG